MWHNTSELMSRLFLSCYALCKTTKYKHRAIQDGVKNSFPCQHFDTHAMLCHKALVFLSAVPLRVLSVSVKGTLSHITQTDRSPQIPTELRFSQSSMVCYWLGFTFVTSWCKLKGDKGTEECQLPHRLCAVIIVSYQVPRCHLSYYWNITWGLGFFDQKPQPQSCSRWAPTTVIHLMS